MRPDRPRQGRRTPLVLVAAASLALALLPAAPAAADSVDQAKAAAHQAALAIQRLQPQLQAAISAYETALDKLASGVTDGISADEAAAQAETQAQAAELVQRRRIRALYMDGGSSALLASVLDASSPQDLIERMSSVRRVMTSDSLSTERALAVADVARTVADASLARSDALTVTAGSVQADLDRVQGLMSAAQATLGSLSAKAKALQDAKDAAAALAAAQRQVDSAGSGAGRRATGTDIPALYLALYHSAAKACPGLDWHVLAAIGQVESHHGSSHIDVGERRRGTDAVPAVRRSPRTPWTATTTGSWTSGTRPTPSSRRRTTCARTAPATRDKLYTAHLALQPRRLVRRSWSSASAAIAAGQVPRLGTAV